MTRSNRPGDIFHCGRCLFFLNWRDQLQNVSMHEISLVQQMFRNLENYLGDDQLAHLTGIRLAVGQLSNVEPSHLESAFQAVILDSGKYTNVHLDLEVTPLMICCDSCGELSPVRHLQFRCGVCGASTTHVVSGFELEIRQLEFEESLNSSDCSPPAQKRQTDQNQFLNQ